MSRLTHQELFKKAKRKMMSSSFREEARSRLHVHISAVYLSGAYFYPPHARRPHSAQPGVAQRRAAPRPVGDSTAPPAGRPPELRPRATSAAARPLRGALRRHKMAPRGQRGCAPLRGRAGPRKPGLYQYRNICQNRRMVWVGRVLKTCPVLSARQEPSGQLCHCGGQLRK